MVETESAGWQGRMRLWLAIDGHNALGPGKVRLLEAIDAEKSLLAASRRLRMSYRLAWQHVQHMEQRFGFAVVQPHRGGPSGGGTDLTRDGKALVDAYHRFRAEVEACLDLACARHFARWSLSSGAMGSKPTDDTTRSSPADQ